MDRITAYIDEKINWKLELELLRETVLSCRLEETIKWKSPVYMSNGKNILGISAFKNYVGIWFFQGGTLKDTYKVLMNAQEGKTQAMRQWRFYSLEDINTDLIKEYVHEAVENQKEVKIIKPKRNTKPLVIHSLMQKELDLNNNFSKQFDFLTLGKRREYAEYILSAKRESTQISRLQKIIPMVINGVGFYDKYKSC